MCEGPKTSVLSSVAGSLMSGVERAEAHGPKIAAESGDMSAVAASGSDAYQ